MALIKCPECGKEFSDTATTCPHCGYSPKTIEYGTELGIVDIQSKTNQLIM